MAPKCREERTRHWGSTSMQKREKAGFRVVLNFVNEQKNLNPVRAVHRRHNPRLLFVAQFHPIKRPLRVSK